MDTKKEKRKDERISYATPLQFTVLPVDESRNPRIEAQGQIVDASKSGIGILTTVSLEPGHVLTWDDKHEQGKLHIALVRWAREFAGGYRAGLMFI